MHTYIHTYIHTHTHTHIYIVSYGIEISKPHHLNYAVQNSLAKRPAAGRGPVCSVFVRLDQGYQYQINNDVKMLKGELSGSVSNSSQDSLCKSIAVSPTEGGIFSKI
jgi:hypothetical protein